MHMCQVREMDGLVHSMKRYFTEHVDYRFLIVTFEITDRNLRRIGLY